MKLEFAHIISVWNSMMRSNARDPWICFQVLEDLGSENTTSFGVALYVDPALSQMKTWKQSFDISL